MIREPASKCVAANSPVSLVRSLDVAARHITAADARMGALIDAVGPCTIAVRRGRYAALVRSVVGQQVSTAAARTIYARLQAAAGGRVAAATIGAVDDTVLRGAGLSRQKVSSVRDLTERVVSGDVNLQRLSALDDEAVIAELTRVRGIGRWTAEMFLMFVLLRGDVLPVDDLGIQNGFRNVYRMRDRPGAERMRKLARAWRPWRTVGCWYLWRSLDLPVIAANAPRPSVPSRQGRPSAR